MSLVGALTPLGKVARNQWFRSVLAYTLAGSFSALVVGAALGSLWRRGFGRVGSWLVILVALTLMAREWGWITVPLPERKRQTQKVWAHEFGFVTASAMWGFDVGLGFGTHLTNGGFL